MENNFVQQHIPKNIQNFSGSNNIQYTRAFRIPNDLVLVFGGLKEVEGNSMSTNACWEYNIDTNVLVPLEEASLFHKVCFCVYL